MGDPCPAARPRQWTIGIMKQKRFFDRPLQPPGDHAAGVWEVESGTGFAAHGAQETVFIDKIIEMWRRRRDCPGYKNNLIISIICLSANVIKSCLRNVFWLLPRPVQLRSVTPPTSSSSPAPFCQHHQPLAPSPSCTMALRGGEVVASVIATSVGNYLFHDAN